MPAWVPVSVVGGEESADQLALAVTRRHEDRDTHQKLAGLWVVQLAISKELEDSRYDNKVRGPNETRADHVDEFDKRHGAFIGFDCLRRKAARPAGPAHSR